MKTVLVISILGLIGFAYRQNVNTVSHKTINKEQKIFKSEDDGKSWADITGNLPFDFDLNDVSVGNNGITLGASRAKVWVSSNSNSDKWSEVELKSLDIFLDHNVNYMVTSIFETNTGTYAYISHDNLYFRQIGSNIWSPIKAPIGIYSVNDLVEKENGKIYISTDAGIYFTSDNGEAWDLLFNDGYALDMIDLGDKILFSAKYGLYQLDQSNNSWSTIMVNNPLENLGYIDEDVLINLYQMEGEIFAYKNIFTRNQPAVRELYESKDQGKTWTKHKYNESISSLGRIDSILKKNGKLYIACVKGIYVSEDNGNHWTQLMDNDDESGRTTMKLFYQDGEFYGVKVAGGC
ncbi:MAG TPA: sialidase family protein [Saprospiraceae bacterium]|nr:exo-alpha-sialidase [Saprospiraceae bacterium]MCB9328906.1 exo-alpha-sialidase [Lewinellaceae bacterium]HRX27981.1 sialidase family protein [Saprospiraceae bacterium]